MKRCAAAVLLITTATASAEPPPAEPEAPASSPAPPPAADAPAAPVRMPPSAMAPRPPAPPGPSEPQTSWFGQFTVGALGGFGGLWAGALIGWGLECASGCDHELGGLLGAAVGAVIGAPTGATIGVAIADRDRAHEASIGMTFLGTAVGSIAGWYAGSTMFDDSAFGGTIVVGASAALGGTLLYRLTRTRTSSLSTLRVVPLGGTATGLAIVGTLR